MAEAYGQYAEYLWAALVALTLVLVIWVILLQRRVSRLIDHYNRLVEGTSGDSLLDALDRYVDRMNETVEQVNGLTELCETVEKDLASTIRRVGIVRYNPFNDTGSDQSFAVALLNGNGSGVVLSSLFGRNSTRIFAKAITAGESSHLLTDEEREAIEKAMSSSISVNGSAV